MDKCAPKPPLAHIRQWLRDLPRPGPKFDMESLNGFAKAIGLDVNRFKKDMETHKFQQVIKEQQAYANKVGARGTPAFFVNGKYLRGIRPFAQMKQMIDAEIAAARKLMAEKKIPKSKVYETIIANGATAPVYLKGGAAGQPQVRIRPGGRPGRPGAPGQPIRLQARPAGR